MISFKPLNKADASNEPSAYTQETLESSCQALYKRALALQGETNPVEAATLYRQVLSSELWQSSQTMSRPTMRMLRYATLKNLGELEGKHGTKEEGLKYLLEALDIDRDDMMVWFRAGIIARELGQLHIAQLAFAQAVKILPSHWFSIENYVEVLYLVGDFEAAAFVINNYAFRLDPDWTKGHALLAQINREDHALPPADNDQGNIVVLVEQRRKRFKKTEDQSIPAKRLLLGTLSFSALLGVLLAEIKQIKSLVCPIVIVADGAMRVGNPSASLEPDAHPRQPSAQVRPKPAQHPVIEQPQIQPHPSLGIPPPSMDVVMEDIIPSLENAGALFGDPGSMMDVDKGASWELEPLDALVGAPPPIPNVVNSIDHEYGHLISPHHQPNVSLDTEHHNLNMMDQDDPPLQQEAMDVDNEVELSAEDNDEYTQSSAAVAPRRSNRAPKKSQPRSRPEVPRKEAEDDQATRKKKDIAAFDKLLLDVTATRDTNGIDFKTPKRQRKSQAKATTPVAVFETESLEVENVILRNNGRPIIFFLAAAVEELCRNYQNPFGEDLIELLMQCIHFLRQSDAKTDTYTRMFAAEYSFDLSLTKASYDSKTRLADALYYLATVYSDLSETSLPELRARTYWLVGSMRLTARSHEEASSYFEKCRDVLVNELQTNSIVLKNLETESLATISADMLLKKVREMEAHREVIAAKSLFEAGDHASVVRDLQRLVTDEKFISALVVSADPDSTVAPTPTTAKSNKDIGDMFSLIDMLRISHMRIREETVENETSPAELAAIHILLRIIGTTPELLVDARDFTYLDDIDAALRQVPHPLPTDAETSETYLSAIHDTTVALVSLYRQFMSTKKRAAHACAPAILACLISILRVDPAMSQEEFLDFLQKAHDSLAAKDTCTASGGVFLRSIIRALDPMSISRQQDLSQDAEQESEQDTESERDDAEEDSELSSVSGGANPMRPPATDLVNESRNTSQIEYILQGANCCLHNLVLPDPDTPNQIIKPHPQPEPVKKDGELKKDEPKIVPTKDELADLYRFIKSVAVSILVNGKQNSLVIKSFYDALGRICKAFEFEEFDRDSATKDLEAYLDGESVSLKVHASGNQYEDVLSSAFYLLAKFGIKHERFKKSETKFFPQIYQLQLLYNPRQEESWLELGRSYAADMRDLVMQNEFPFALEADEDASKELLQRLQQCDFNFRRSARCYEKYLQTRSSIAVLFELGNVYHLRYRLLSIRGQPREEWIPSLERAIECYSLSTHGTESWPRHYMLGKSMESMLKSDPTSLTVMTHGVTDLFNPDHSQKETNRVTFSYKDCLFNLQRAMAVRSSKSASSNPYVRYRFYATKINICQSLLYGPMSHFMESEPTEELLDVLREVFRHQWNEPKKRGPGSAAHNASLADENKAAEADEIADLSSEDLEEKLKETLGNSVMALSYLCHNETQLPQASYKLALYHAKGPKEDRYLPRSMSFLKDLLGIDKKGKTIIIMIRDLESISRPMKSPVYIRNFIRLFLDIAEETEEELEATNSLISKLSKDETLEPLLNFAVDRQCSLLSRKLTSCKRSAPKIEALFKVVRELSYIFKKLPQPVIEILIQAFGLTTKTSISSISATETGIKPIMSYIKKNFPDEGVKPAPKRVGKKTGKADDEN